MNCPSCGKTLSAPESAVGKKAKCPACGTLMIVPEAVLEAEEIGAAGEQPASNDYNLLDDITGAAASQPPTSPAGLGQEPARRPCPECGEMIVAGAAKCRFCGAVFDPRVRAGGTTSRLTSVPNYLVQAILVTLFCCLPFGIVAIVFASQVNARVQAGDMRGALSASQSAKTWCWISFGIGLAAIAAYVMLPGGVRHVRH